MSSHSWKLQTLSSESLGEMRKRDGKIMTMFSHLSHTERFVSDIFFRRSGMRDASRAGTTYVKHFFK